MSLQVLIVVVALLAVLVVAHKRIPELKPPARLETPVLTEVRPRHFVLHAEGGKHLMVGSELKTSINCRVVIT
jgi:hypothetical protein